MNDDAPGIVIRTVGEFTRGLEKWFKNQSAFRGAAISGEVSGLKEITGGHVTFKLKDQGGVLECIVWQSKLARLPQLLEGTAIVAIGNVELRAERSSYQLLVDDVRLTGIGELFARFEALKERFRSEGLFDEKRKRAIPRFVRRVALISAPKSKASEDFLATMRSKVPFVSVTFLATRVQGVGADVDIREAFDRAERLDVDAIVLTRGGGSYEDLFTFNEEVVVRAIARSKHPVITAIGHQEDHHLADDVADAVFGTPSKAAEAIAHAWVMTGQRLAHAGRNLDRAVETALGRAAQRIVLQRSQLDGAVRTRVGAVQNRLVALDRRLNAQNPGQRLAQRSTRLEGLRSRLAPAWELYASRRSGAVALASSRLAGVDPNAPLARGYALIARDGKLVRSAAELAVGEAFTARLGHGAVDARVEAVRDE
ncbi:MAG TPA: exodeoxyribonuclease VII large subunit [Candidatus Baltobacteraceae bacterium]|nr:exodeoxyribonuclease VII large subunit [Candidatus Baltobacteraceae bacterium]